MSTQLIDKTLVVDSFKGDGVEQTILKRATGFTGMLMKATGTVSDCTFDCDGVTSALDLRGGRASNIVVQNFANVGIACRQDGCIVENSTITGLGIDAPQGIGVWADFGMDDSTSILTVRGCDLSGSCLNALYLTGGKLFIIENRIHGNYFYGGTGGGQICIGNALTRNTTAFIYGNVIKDGGIPNAGGMELGGGQFVVMNNEVRNHGCSGIGLGHYTFNSVLENNRCVGNGTYTTEPHVPQNRAGIIVGWGAKCVSVHNNYCTHNGNYGVIINGPMTDPRFPNLLSEKISVTGNPLNGNPSGKVFDGDTTNLIPDKIIIL